MANILYGPESQIYSSFDPRSPAPPAFTDGTLAVRGRHRLGTQLVLPDGRKFRFALVGGSALVVGDALTGAAVVSTDISMTASVTAAGARSISFTHGAATVVINYFAEGYANISLAPGAGWAYPIASHAALTNGGVDTVYLQEGHTVQTALTATSDVSLVPHVYAGVIQAAATTLTGIPCGVAVLAIPAGDFGWVQTRGVASVLTAGTVVIGQRATLPTGTAGAVGPLTLSEGTPNTGGGVADIGLVHRVEATTEWSAIDLRIDG